MQNNGNIGRTITGSRVLVTGGAGFIGSNLCDALLQQDNEVVCLDNLSTGRKENIIPYLENPRFRFIEGDIRDLAVCRGAVDGIDYILHQAALGSVPRSIDNPLNTNSVNVTGFLNMLQAAREVNIKRFVYAVSSSVYGDAVDLPKVEERIGKPLSPYAVTKYVNELYAAVFSDLYGIETIGLRYFNVFGRRQTPNGAYAAAIPKFIKAFMEHHAPVIHGDGKQFRDFTYIKNVVQANQLAALANRPEALNTVYNVAYGESTSVLELVQYLQELLGEFDPKIRDVPLRFGPKRKGDVEFSLASVDKARDLLGYRPEYNLKDGLKEAIHWYWDYLRQWQRAAT
ncbi:MAG: SDR family oxidoreductase [Bacteroidota bacterium]